MVNRSHELSINVNLLRIVGKTSSIIHTIVFYASIPEYPP